MNRSPFPPDHVPCPLPVFRGGAGRHQESGTGLPRFGTPSVPGSTVLPAVLICLGVMAAGCDRRPPPPPAVAELGDDVIRLPELEAELERVRKESGSGHSQIDAGEQGALRRAVLEQLIDRRLLLAEALRRGLSVSDQELEEAIRRRLAAREPEFDDVDIRQAAAEPGVTPAMDVEQPRAGLRGQVIGRADRERLRNQLLIDKLLLAEVVSRVALGPDEARNWYDENPGEFEIDEQVRCRQILVPTREIAVAIRRELSRGGDFAALALEHSTTPDARNGGDLGFFARGVMPEVIEENCFKLRHNQLSEVVESPYGGYHLFQRTDFQSASTIPFEEVEDAIEMKLTRRAIARAQETFIRKLRADTGVRIREDVLEGRALPAR